MYVKDLFSAQASEYAKFRPAYPPALIHDIVSLCSDHHLAWDAGTGNGQFAVLLSDYFENVIASDISEKQLANAAQKENIRYTINDSTQTDLADHSVDLITVAQAVHWFSFEKFYSEAKRVLQKDGIIALVGYNLPVAVPEVNDILLDFYNNTVGSYWDKERRMVDESYRNIPFPFDEIQIGKHSIPYTWNIDQLIGYISTWSALQHYRKRNNKDPLPLLKEQFLGTGHTEFNVEFPVFCRIGRV